MVSMSGCSPRRSNVAGCTEVEVDLAQLKRALTASSVRA